MNFPRMFKIRQNFPSLGLADIPGETVKALSSSGLSKRISFGMLVGITAGSRGISNISLILKEVVAYVKSLGGTPIILAAMGSHGGGTATGQKDLLALLGITGENTGAQVVCSEEYTEIARAFYGEVYVSKEALECDAIIVVNRVKPHTSFHGDHESGLLKMLAAGLGGPPGAASLHRCEPRLLSRAVAEAGQAILKKTPVVLGLAILEDAFDQTRLLAPVRPGDFFEVEKDLLREARKYLPTLPVQDLDVLIVDQIGKNFSGTGMDTNVIGRLRIQGTSEPDSPRVKRIIVLDVAPAAHGNAYGIGLADFTTARLFEKLDRKAIHLNALTSTFVQRAMIPITLPNDLEALKAALKSLSAISPSHLRVIRIHNTLDLSEMLVSESLFQEISCLPFVEITESPNEMKFAADWNLPPF